MGEEPTSSVSVCVATVDDSTSSEECEDCEPLASILDRGHGSKCRHASFSTTELRAEENHSSAKSSSSIY